MAAQDKDGPWWLNFWGFFLLCVIALGLILVYGLSVYLWFADWSDSGPFGDSFGAITALFTALAFAGLIFTMLIQREELQLQRKELALLREEQAGSREQLENQFNVMARQSFDNNFFNLMSAVRDLKESAGPRNVGKTWSSLMGKYSELEENPEAATDDEFITSVKSTQKLNGDCQPYFNQLSRLWLYVHREAIADKLFYYELIMAECNPMMDQLLVLQGTDANFSDLNAAVDEYQRFNAEVSTP